MVITQQPEPILNLFEFAPHLCVCVYVSSPAAGGFTSAEMAVRKQLKTLLLLKVPAGGVRRQETEHREDMDTLTAVMLVLLAPVSCEGKKIFYLFYLKKKMVEMCLFARSQSCG